MNSRQYGRYCVAISLALIAVKLWAGSHVDATALMHDDHENLNRSIYVVRGDLQLTGYPFSKIAYGPLYPLVVSPWMLVADPSARLTAVFAINAALSTVVVFAGSLIVFRLTGVASLLVPLCLAAYPPLFLYSFYAMTENLLLPLLVLVGWLVVDFEKTCQSARRSMCLLLLAALLPLVRVPGLAVVPALLVLLWMHRRPVFQRVSPALALGLTVLLPAGSYFILYRLAIRSTREEAYLAALADLAVHPHRWLFPFKSALSQVGYLFVSTGFWVLPVLVVVALQVRGARVGPHRQRWINYLTYTALTAGSVIGFAVVHLLHKLKFANADFIYGRYADPAGVLLLIGGLAGALALQPLTGVQRFVVRVVAPLALLWVLGGIAGTKWAPVNQCGLAIFASGDVALGWVLLGTVLATVVSQLVDEKRWFVPAALTFVLVFAVVSDREGQIYTRVRARRVAYTLQASEWIAANVPSDGRIGFDASIMDRPAPGMNIRVMANVYRGMMFRTYPRTTAIVDSQEALKQVDYLYSNVLSQRWSAGEGAGLVQVWTNGVYVLYRVSHQPRS